MDGLHPSLKGYEVWAAGLEPILTELLGYDWDRVSELRKKGVI